MDQSEDSASVDASSQSSDIFVVDPRIGEEIDRLGLSHLLWTPFKEWNMNEFPRKTERRQITWKPKSLTAQRNICWSFAVSFYDDVLLELLPPFTFKLRPSCFADEAQLREDCLEMLTLRKIKGTAAAEEDGEDELYGVRNHTYYTKQDLLTMPSYELYDLTSRLLCRHAVLAFDSSMRFVSEDNDSILLYRCIEERRLDCSNYVLSMIRNAGKHVFRLTKP